MPLNSLLAAFLTLLVVTPGPTTYRAVVIDAITRQPIPNVTVQDVTGGTTCVTNHVGQFDFPLTATGTMQLHLLSIGYAPTYFARTASGALDTLYLAPSSQALLGVIVRPGRQVLLTPFRGQPRIGASYHMIPSVQVAVHLAGLPSGQTGRINQLQLQLKPIAIRAGALRVSLRTPGTEGAASGPVGRELLPAPLEISTAQLAAAPKGLLILDLSSYNLELPATGVFVLVEGLGKDTETYQVTRLNDYPILGAAETDDPACTWLLGANAQGWQLYQPKNGKTHATNSLVSLIVMAN